MNQNRKEKKENSSQPWSSYKIVHFFFFFNFFCPWPTAISIAKSNTSCTPIISLLLHSAYRAPMRFATSSPCCCVTGVIPCVLRSSITFLFFRRSVLRPTRTTGVEGQKWRTSGYHYKRNVLAKILYVNLQFKERKLPCLKRSQGYAENLSRNKQTGRRFLDTIVVLSDRIPPARLCPITPTQQSSHWLHVFYA